jgi:diguanylate cyclase (GGDEF)-like protein
VPDLESEEAQLAADDPLAASTRLASPGGTGGREADRASAGSAGPHPGPGIDWKDPLTGLPGPLAWDRLLQSEEARLERYRRPVTIVLGELDGLRRLTERFGPSPADRLLPAVGDAFRREARASDQVVRLSWSRFAALLPETDEIQAINYVERVRLACDRWLESGAVSLRLSLGWASPPPSGGIEVAFRMAEARMHENRRALPHDRASGHTVDERRGRT